MSYSGNNIVCTKKTKNAQDDENRPNAYDYGCFEVGTCRVEITPPLSVPYLGFEPRHSFFTGVHDPLYIRSVVVSGTDNEAAIISSDTIGFIGTLLGKDRDFINEVKQSIERKTGMPAKSVMLASNHIHSTPDTLDIRPLRDTPGALSWLESLVEKIACSVDTASKNRFRAHLKIGKGCAPGISHNRRKEPYLDNEVVVLFFESPDKSDNVIMVNYACHPVIVQVQELVSADYVGVMTSTVENTLKDMKNCLFLQGACGDINPRLDDTRDFRDVYLAGTALAGEVIRIYGIIAAGDYPVQPVAVKTASKSIMLPSRPLPPLEERERFYREVEDLRHKLEKSGIPEEKTGILKLLGSKEEEYYRLKEGDKPYPAEIQVIRLGNCILAGIPGEPFCRMGLEIKDICREFTGIPVGYANGYTGYIAPPESWEKGGYEMSMGLWSKVGPGSFGMILDTLGEQIKTLL